MGSQLQNGKQQFETILGTPLVGGQVYFYALGTETPQDTFQDEALTIPNTNPVILDARGQAVIWGDGVYRQVVYDRFGVLIWDQTVSAAASLADLAGSNGASLIGFNGTTLAALFNLNLNHVVDSIAQLRTLSKVVFGRAFVTGYYGPHDGGGGPYQYDPSDTTSSDNGGTIIVAADGGRWKLQTTSRVSLKQFGCYIDDTHDDAARFNIALAAGVPLYFPGGSSAMRLTSTIVVPSGVDIMGDGTAPFIVPSTSSPSNISTRGIGSWFHFDHVGVGLSVEADSTGYVCGVSIRRCGSFRNQPDVPSSGSWSAAANDNDIFFAGASDCTVDDFCFLNPTKAIYVTDYNGNASGRIRLSNIRGQPFNYGIVVDNAQDVCYVENVHFWPFWSLATPVINYTQANLIAYMTARADGIHFTNIFSISHFIGYYISANASGTTYKFHLMNADFDNGTYGVLLDPTVGTTNAGAGGATGECTNLTMQGTGSNAILSSGITMQGNNSQIQWGNPSITAFPNNGLLVTGSGNVGRLGAPKIDFANTANNGSPGIQVNSGNQVYVSGIPELNIANGAPMYGGSGGFSLPIETGSITGTTDGNGKFTFNTETTGIVPSQCTMQWVGGTTANVNEITLGVGSVTFQAVNPTTGVPLANTGFAVSYIASWRGQWNT